MKYRPFRLDQHQAAGVRIKRLRAELLSMAAEYGQHYPKKTLALTRLHLTLKALDAARNTLDDLVCAENPDVPWSQSQTLTRCYYGPEEGRGNAK